jgi:hypothetical protein
MSVDNKDTQCFLNTTGPPTRTARALATIEKSLEDRVRTAEFDPDQLESFMVAAFELLGKPQAQARELARAILKAAERPQSGDPGPPDRDPPRRLV